MSAERWLSPLGSIASRRLYLPPRHPFGAHVLLSFCCVLSWSPRRHTTQLFSESTLVHSLHTRDLRLCAFPTSHTLYRQCGLQPAFSSSRRSARHLTCCCYGCLVKPVKVGCGFSHVFRKIEIFVVSVTLPRFATIALCRSREQITTMTRLVALMVWATPAIALAASKETSLRGAQVRVRVHMRALHVDYVCTPFLCDVFFLNLHSTPEPQNTKTTAVITKQQLRFRYFWRSRVRIEVGALLLYCLLWRTRSYHPYSCRGSEHVTLHSFCRKLSDGPFPLVFIFTWILFTVGVRRHRHGLLYIKVGANGQILSRFFYVCKVVLPTKSALACSSVWLLCSLIRERPAHTSRLRCRCICIEALKCVVRM